MLIASHLYVLHPHIRYGKHTYLQSEYPWLNGLKLVEPNKPTTFRVLEVSHHLQCWSSRLYACLDHMTAVDIPLQPPFLCPYHSTDVVGPCVVM